MRVRVDVDAEPMLPQARASMRVFVLTELHRVLLGLDALVDEVEVTARRVHRKRAPGWTVVARVTARGLAPFEVRADAPRPHAAADEVIYAIWQRLRAVRDDREPAPTRLTA
ncbi:MAG: hypothetical protein R3A48_06090 [Polyangiales bacterium]